MTMATSKPGPKALRWPFVVGLASAGLLSVVLATPFRTWMISGEDEENSIVMPVDRASKVVNRHAGQAVDAPMAQPVVSALRMEHGLIQNPFGELNLMASAEQDYLPTMSKVPRVLVPAKKRKSTAESPPLPQATQLVALPPAPPPPPAVAPPIPFAVAGAIHGTQIAEGHRVAFLRQRDEILVVRPGDAIGQSYRVESITADKIEFTYLPLKQRQTLSMTP